MDNNERRLIVIQKEIQRELRNNPTGLMLERLRSELDELLAGQVKKQAGLLEKLARLLRRKEE